MLYSSPSKDECRASSKKNKIKKTNKKNPLPLAANSHTYTHTQKYLTVITNNTFIHGPMDQAELVYTSPREQHETKKHLVRIFY